ncbi:MAG: dihydrolipoyl dehydrogenase [Bacteroidales bacterium]
MADNNKHELVIIGAGPGGYRAAFMAADLGLKVTLIDPEINPGGVCLYRGCIPTKALLHLAKIKKDAEEADEIGLKFNTGKVNLDKVRSWKDEVVNKLTGGLGQLVKAHKIEYIRARAKFTGPNELKLQGEDLDKKRIKFQNAIISAGAKPVTLASVDPQMKEIMNSEQALELNDIPEKLLIIGGGYIGLEMATIYKALGSEISIVELLDDFMPGIDKDLLREYKKANPDLFEDIFFETKVNKVEKQRRYLDVTFSSKEGKEFIKKYDKILISIGQKPNTENLGLDKVSVDLDEKGFIKVDSSQQTSKEGIYAIGDISGPPLLAHKASYEGRVAAEAISGKKTANDARAIPAVVYTEPEIATCGLSENEAKEKNINYKKVKFSWSASGRAGAMNEKRGFTKLLVDPESELILGAGIVGKNAGDMISELVLAMEMGATAEDVALTIHPHPTLSETIMEAAELFYGHPTHIFAKK